MFDWVLNLPLNIKILKYCQEMTKPGKHITYVLRN